MAETPRKKELSDAERQMQTNIKKFRAELGWSQAELAMHAGMSLSMMTKIESGERGALTHLDELARAMGRSTADFLMPAPPPPNPSMLAVAAYRIPPWVDPDVAAKLKAKFEAAISEATGELDRLREVKSRKRK